MAPSFVIPTSDGFPEHLGPSGNPLSYHKYDIQVVLGCEDPNKEQGEFKDGVRQPGYCWYRTDGTLWQKI